VASAQSFTLWQQATIEITCDDHSIACLCHVYMGVILHAHPVCGESHIQRNTNWEVATTSPPFYNEPHQSHVLFVKVAPGTTFTSWSEHHFVAIESPSGKCAKLHTVAASNNRDHMPCHSIIACSCHIYIYRCYSSRTSRSRWIAYSTQHQLGGCNSWLS